MSKLNSKRFRNAAVAAGGVILLGLSLVIAQFRVKAASSVTLTITPQGASTLTIGSAYLWQCKAVNTSGGSLTYNTTFYITPPGGTKIQVSPPVGLKTIKSGAYIQISSATTTSAYTSLTGAFTYECDAVDNSGNVLAAGTTTFTILPLPASLIVPQFTDAASTAGITMTHHANSADCINMMGTGGGWADYDGDGNLDVFVSDFNGPSHLFHNSGNGTFTDVTATAFPGLVSSSGQLILPNATGVSWADYNNDGRPDLLVLTVGNPYLFKNNGDGTFTNVAPSVGLSGFVDLSGNPLRGETATWGDYDGDGYLDLYITNYRSCTEVAAGGPTGGQPDLLFHNNGGTSFTQVDSLLGGETNAALNGLGFAATWFDFNNDNRPDLYVVNDFGNKIEPNVLWRNDGLNTSTNTWTFTNVSSSSSANSKMEAMGLAIFDYNRDGNFDMGVTNVGSQVLLQNNGNGTFTNVARNAGFERAAFLNTAGTGYMASTTWGISPADFDNDGYEDIISGGGAMMMTSMGMMMPNALLMNNYNSHLTGVTNDGVFLDLTYLSGMDSMHTSSTIAVADYDGDGRMDILEVNYMNQLVNLYHNNSAALGNTNHWLEVRLIGACLQCAPNTPGMSNQDGVGAKLTLVSPSGTQYRQIISGTSLGAGNQVWAHFGLGQDSSITSLTILWPSGVTETCTALPINSRVKITEGSTCSFSGF